MLSIAIVSNISETKIVNTLLLNSKTPSEMKKDFFDPSAAIFILPVFKNVTHLPPFMGMLFALGILWVVTEFVLRKKPSAFRSKYSVYRALEKVDMPSVLFFLGRCLGCCE